MGSLISKVKPVETKLETNVNPFAESLLTEHIAPEDFVRIFSPLIIENARALFRHGNVVLKGTPGSGKSMLLALLKPETRIAYHRAGQQFPVEVSNRKFISAGINLTRVGTQDFGNRLAVEGIAGKTKQDLSLFFADFFNYYLTLDLLRNIKVLATEENREIRKEIGLSISDKQLDIAAKAIASDACWFRYLEGVSSFDELLLKIEQRVIAYRSYFNFNTDEIDKRIRETKTAVGEPIAAVANVLRNEQIISEETLVFIRVDQLEELYQLETHHGLGSCYRQMINKALAMRDRRISYRLGTRGYAWEDEPIVYGTGSKLEQERDFTVIALDDILKRAENRKIWRFPELVADIFKRRLESAGYKISEGSKPDALLKRVFEKAPPREELARIYAGSSPHRVLDLAPEWPEEWKEYLRDLATTNPLSAKFGEAWARQKGKESIVNTPPRGIPPWEEKRWWKKERHEHALMLIASRAGQRLVWSGADDILELSGGNVLVFITLCRHIWQALLRSEFGQRRDQGLPTIDVDIQATGIYDASRSWAERVIPQGYNGNSRSRVVDHLGTWFAKSLANDRAMSNPGHNGFSLAVEDLLNSPDVQRVLNLGTDFGDLVSLPHTTKLRDRKSRKKWYLAPILSPYFRIPHVHTKEPIYTTAAEVARQLELPPPPKTGNTVEVKAPIKKTPPREIDGQLPLFGEGQE